MASRWAMAAIEREQEGLAGGMLLFNEVDAVHREVCCIGIILGLAASVCKIALWEVLKVAHVEGYFQFRLYTVTSK